MHIAALRRQGGESACGRRSLNTTSVYVTHDQTEAMTLGDRVAVLKKGVLQQIASPRELYEQPANLFVAGFIGAPSMNFLPGTVETNSAGNPCLSTPLGEIELPEHLASAGKGKEIVLAGIRPESFEEASQVEERRRGHGSVISAELSHVEWLGNEQYGYIGYENDPRVVETLQRLAEDMDSDDLRTQLVVALDAMSRVRGGDTIDLWVETRRIHLFDPATGENLTRDAEAGAELTRLAAEDRKRDRERQASRD